MNPAHRDGWPPAQAPVTAPGAQQTEQPSAQGTRLLGAFSAGNASQQPPTQASPAQGPAPVLPPPPGAPFYTSNGAATTHNQGLPSLPGLGAGAARLTSPHQPAQRPSSSDAGPAPPNLQGAPQGPQYTLPGISQTLQQSQMQSSNQANLARDRELHDRENRERDIMETHAAQQHAAAQQEEMAKRDAEQRERDLRERQQHELAAHENHSGPIQVHQPVAVAPPTRTIHGPNGLLGQSGPLGGPNGFAPPMNGPNAPGGIFGNVPVQQGDTTPRMQHAVQPPQPPPQASILMPFGGAPGQMAVGQGQQPILNDALSYLDQVKVQFADHPDVYNQFLDIMKDFKSGVIDTPGVIERVSTLFAGNPDLIQGFNTFLPPGYKIECGTNGDPNNIRVTTPMGTTMSSIPAPRPRSPPRSAAANGVAPSPNEGSYYEAAQNRHWQQTRQAPGAPPEALFSPNNRNLGLPLFAAQQGAVPLSPPDTNRSHPDVAASAAALAHQAEQRGVSHLQNAVSAAAGRSILEPSGETSTPLLGQAILGANHAAQMGIGAEKRGPVEFNHAISYVNKIKNRFASQPDIYKQFLEILQTYQRESKPIQDVYAQVTGLFSSAPDLLEDFKQFLPESAAQHRAQQQAARHAAEDAMMLNNVRGETAYAQAPSHQQTPRADASRLPPMGNFAPTPTANRDNKRKRGERQGPGAASAPMPTPMQQDVPTSSVRGGNASYPQAATNKRTKTGHGAKQPIVPDGPPVSPTLMPAMPEPLPPTTTTTPNQEELAFFDRVKKFLQNKNSMNEFLKLCNLFSQDLIDNQLFINRAHAFIGGNPELFNWFKKFMGDADEHSIHTRPKTVNSRVSLSNCRSHGPSYRLLPKRERERQCSGRDDLCRNVLNDEWASHPTWASEDSGFVAHRKNQFEEGLHRIEEERHDYDFNIEACTRTIQQLEPIAQQLLTMKPDERANFHLPPGLGGQSETIYKRVIMKIYGRDKGKDVINNLFTMPWSVIPVLLHRLKSKLEDWKAAQREWEKVWREQTQKIFWRSLDHQSLSVKQADKRQFQPKALQNEIQVRYEEQKRMLDIQEVPQPDYQFAFSFKDEDVICDVARLMLTFAENNNGADLSKAVPFIKEFVPLFFGIDVYKFEQSVQSFGRDSSTNESGDDTPSADEDASQRSQKPKKGDLRRGVLDPKGKRKDKEDSIASASRDTTPEVASAVEEDIMADISISNIADEQPSAQWINHSTKAFTVDNEEVEPDEPYRRSVYNMYANSNIYCFFRMFVYLYERLLKLKESEDSVRRIVQRANQHKAAHDLKMFDKTPADFFKDTSETANYYQQIVDMFQDQVLGDVEMNQIEETLRRYYLQCGWQLYSFDRLMNSLVRFSAAVVNNDSKDKTQDIYNLFKKDRVNDTTTHKAEIAYRKNVEKYAKDTDTFRITYDPERMEAYVRLFKRDDPTFEFNALDRIKRWRAYIASYTALEPTEGVARNKVSKTFLKRNLPKGDESPEREVPVRYTDKLLVSINPNSYALKFSATGSSDSSGVLKFVHPPKVRFSKTDDFSTPAEASDAVKKAHRERCREKFIQNANWMKDMSSDEVDAREAAFQKVYLEEAKVVKDDSDEDLEMADAA